MAERQPQIQITRRLGYDWLVRLIDSQRGAPTAVVGTKHHAQQLIHRLFNDRMDLRMQVFTNGNDYVAIVNPDGSLRWDLHGRRYAAPMELKAIRNRDLSHMTNVVTTPLFRVDLVDSAQPGPEHLRPPDKAHSPGIESPAS
jgi:hypothetical protein